MALYKLVMYLLKLAVVQVYYNDSYSFNLLVQDNSSIFSLNIY